MTESTTQDQEQLRDVVRQRYAAAAEPRYAAARLWVDALLDPAETRSVLARSLACTAMNPQIPEFRTGVLQT